MVNKLKILNRIIKENFFKFPNEELKYITDNINEYISHNLTIKIRIFDDLFLWHSRGYYMMYYNTQLLFTYLIINEEFNLLKKKLGRDKYLLELKESMKYYHALLTGYNNFELNKDIKHFYDDNYLKIFKYLLENE